MNPSVLTGANYRCSFNTGYKFADEWAKNKNKFFIHTLMLTAFSTRIVSPYSSPWCADFRQNMFSHPRQSLPSMIVTDAWTFLCFASVDLSTFRSVSPLLTSSQYIGLSDSLILCKIYVYVHEIKLLRNSGSRQRAINSRSYIFTET